MLSTHLATKGVQCLNATTCPAVTPYTVCYSGLMMSELEGVPQTGWMQGQWPKKGAEISLHILKNAENNIRRKGLDETLWSLSISW